MLKKEAGCILQQESSIWQRYYRVLTDVQEKKNGQRLDNNMAELKQKWQEGGGGIQLRKSKSC